MIYTERKVSIKNDKATIDSPIILFRGDREVEIMFTIVDSKFKFESNKGNVIDKTQAAFGQLAVALPDGTDLFTEIVKCKNGVVVFSITGEMIDEVHEVGFYSFHIRLYNDDKTSRITLPPVMEGIEIREPLIIEGDVENTDLVGDATVGYSMVQAVGVDEEVFDEDGNYIPTVWGIGDKITANKLNKIETSLVSAFQSNIFIDAEISDDILHYNDGYRLNNDGTEIEDADWSCTDFIRVDQILKIVGYAYGTDRVTISTYDKNKQLIKNYFGDIQEGELFYRTELTLTPKDAYYVRAVDSKKYNLLVTVSYNLSDDNVHEMILEDIYNIKEQVTKLAKYEECKTKVVYFTVQVNQCFPDNNSLENVVVDDEEMADVSCALVLPDSYSAYGKPTKIAVVMHGAGGKVTDSSIGEMTLFNKLVDAGYAMFDVNGCNNEYSDHMGGPRAISAYVKAFEWIKSHYNVEDKMYVHGHSMGGLTALNLMYHHPSLCKVLGLFYPVINLQAAWERPWFPGDEGTRFAMARDYNFDDKTGNTFENDKIIGFNPIENNSIIINDERYSFINCPMKIWHGLADNTILIENTEQMVSNILRANGYCEFRKIESLAHDVTDVIVNEMILWFNRF